MIRTRKTAKATTDPGSKPLPLEIYMTDQLAPSTEAFVTNLEPASYMHSSCLKCIYWSNCCSKYYLHALLCWALVLLFQIIQEMLWGEGFWYAIFVIHSSDQHNTWFTFLLPLMHRTISFTTHWPLRLTNWNSPKWKHIVSQTNTII